jgi:rSAM/selenodomain-associated transferase 1
VTRGWLSVFAKAPQPGRVKTRLSPPLAPETAAALYAAMLEDVLRASADFARRLGLEPVLHFDPPAARGALERYAPPGYQFRPQRGEGLAERMANAFEEAAAEGVERVLLRGSDSPGLDLPVVAAALAGLEDGDDLVLTPDQGGGYALIALKEPRRELFEVVLSTGSVLEETVARARALGLAVSSTPASFDLDLVADLVRLDDLPVERSSVLCPRTVEFVRDLRARAVL